MSAKKPKKGCFIPQKAPKGTRIRHWEDYGDDSYSCDIAFTDRNGERVIGTFVRTGWAWARREVRDDIMEALSHPTIAVYKGG